MEDRSSRARPKRFELLTPKFVGAEQRPRAKKRRECQRAEAHTRSSVSRKLKKGIFDLHICNVPRKVPAPWVAPLSNTPRGSHWVTESMDVRIMQNAPYAANQQ
jgi:hypothetical protein